MSESQSGENNKTHLLRILTRMSVSVRVGFAGVSLKMSLVLGRMAAFTTSGSLKSTKLNVTPRSENITRAARFVPPYEHSVITQWSPVFPFDHHAPCCCGCRGWGWVFMSTSLFVAPITEERRMREIGTTSEEKNSNNLPPLTGLGAAGSHDSDLDTTHDHYNATSSATTTTV